ncbi:MAG: DNA-protecting protein DprA [Deltaproteobacteria bacterium]|nr:DNA-protecting protein DprA [Deltaproteobacteria bacterium]MBW2661574.1 DNA-protecting protein DprA [Deltaproteobacteria bacterium]
MENILPWFALKSVPGIGNHLFKRLIDKFKSPHLVFEASSDDLLKVDGITDRLASAIRRHQIPEHVKKDFDSVVESSCRIVTMLDPDYPPLLLEIPDPPPFLYVFGKLDSSIMNIAIVGSRNATPYGLSTTKRLCNDLALRGITIVSGMARGIDTAAHEGALMGKGKTIAVLGSGFERVYPAENIKLFHKIAENGAVVSEFALKTEPEAYNFPIRNRIISGISLGTVVVEATRKSGSLITARLAAEQNREVFAVPGSINSFKSIGAHTLIKQGAKLVEHAQDIIEELSPLIQAYAADDKNKKMDKLPPLSSEESLVLKELGPYPVHIDEISRNISMEPGKLSSILLRLELKEIVDQAPGKLFSIKE